jgi:LmbE family N-acetylglucosaminyl deacetylase
LYLGLTDGDLVAQASLIDEAMADILADFKPARAFTLGKDGYDGHPDHIAMHESTLRVIGTLGLHSALHTLASEHQGEITMSYTVRKLGAMALHVSQRLHHDLSHWGGTNLYTPLITEKETYNINTAHL